MTSGQRVLDLGAGVGDGYATTIHSQQGAGAPLAVPSITKSDDARSAHVSLTRAMEGLHVHTRMTAEQLVRHLTSPERMASKDDAALYQRLVMKTGGPNTLWAKAVAKATKTIRTHCTFGIVRLCRRLKPCVATRFANTCARIRILIQVSMIARSVGFWRSTLQKPLCRGLLPNGSSSKENGSENARLR
jgi:hypothetical protein